MDDLNAINETNETDERTGDDNTIAAQPRGLHMSRHGAKRAAQRNIPLDALEYVMTYGRTMRRTGALFYFLGHRDLPPMDRHNARIARLVGTVVIVEGGSVITLYRNPAALRDIKRKLKYRTRACPDFSLAVS